jgi:hypothetical protein
MYTVEHFPQFRHPFVVFRTDDGVRLEAFNTRAQAVARAIALTERDEIAGLFSDLYKDVYGMRPRVLLARAQAEGWTVQDFRDEIDALKATQITEFGELLGVS